MKIARIIYAYTPYSFGGTDIYAGKISKALDDKGHETVIITINPFFGEKYEIEGSTKIYRFHPFNVSTVHNIGRKNFILQAIWTFLDIYSIYSYFKIKKILKKEKPDIVHIHTPLDFTIAAISAAKSLNLPVVYTLHDFYLLCRRCILIHRSGELCTAKNINLLCHFYRWFTRKIANKVDCIIAPSRFVLDMHKKAGFFLKTKNVVLPHGIELKESFEANVQKEDEIVDFLYVGVLIKHKGVDILIKAFKDIKHKNVKLHIVGSGVLEKELKTLAQDDDRIIFYGKYSHQEVQEFYKKVDLVVFPSVCYETRGNVIVEAFRAKLPVIASNIGGVPESVKNNYNGFLFEPGNSLALKSILEDIVENSIDLKRLGENAFKTVEEFEMGIYIDKLSDVYSQIM